MLEIKQQVQSFIHKYLEVKAKDEAVIVDYALKTWLPRPHQVQYLQFLGGPATGKTRAADVMGAICRNPMLPNGYMTAPALTVSMDKEYPCTLILDECGSSVVSGDQKKVLQVGAEKSNRIIRMVTLEDASVHPVSYMVFGYKVLCSVRKFRDPAIQSRCITVKLSGATRKHISPDLGYEFKRDRVAIQQALKAFENKSQLY